LPGVSQRGAAPSGNQFAFDLGFEFVDFNYDGKDDLLFPDTALTNSVAYLNEGSAQDPQFSRHERYPINFTETWPQTVEHTQSYAVADLNGDGLFDYILYDGYLRFVPDSGSAHRRFHWVLPKGEKYYEYFPASKAMQDENMRYATGPESFFWKDGIFARQMLTLTVADWDGDGLLDLLISRFKHQAPGVVPVGTTANEDWNSYGRFFTGTPAKQQIEGAQDFSEPLAVAPERGLYFYKNVGTKTEPYFDKGVEIKTPDGKSIVAPNPVVADMDGDGVLDLLSCETKYSSNAFRIDWPVRDHLVWFKRAKAVDTAVLQPESPVLDAKGQPIPSGTMARIHDLSGGNRNDLFVLDPAPKIGIRWYRNEAAPRQKPRYAAPRTLSGSEFARIGMMGQPVVADWFAPGSRDLLVHGDIDSHCKWGLRRTALYRNVAKGPGEVEYRFVGWLNYNGDDAMVPATMEDSNYDVYGTAIGFYQDAGQKYLVMSVSGRLYLFSGLDQDGLTFHKRVELPIKAQRNRYKGWQEIPINSEQPLKYLRIDNFRNGQGAGRDGLLNVVRLEVFSEGRNVATMDNIASMESHNPDDKTKHNNLIRPMMMLDPASESKTDTKNFTSWGASNGPLTIEFKQPLKIDKVRFLLSDREGAWFDYAWPFYWQGKLFHPGAEDGDAWYQYKIDTSVDGTKWDKVVDRTVTDMNRSFPLMVDWNKDGKTDMLLGDQIAYGHFPQFKEYHLYLNTGTNAAPVFDSFKPLLTETGAPIHNDADWGRTYGCHADLAVRDMDGDGKLDLIVEGYRNLELLVYRNVSENEGELKFQKVGRLGGKKAVLYPVAYPHFYYGDVDGDTIPDLMFGTATPDFFKGVAATAPEVATDWHVVTSDKTGVHMQWTKPAGATRYEVRWSEDELVTDLNWGRMAKVEGEYGPDATATATITPTVPGKRVYLAVKSLNAKGEYSGISDAVSSYALPLRQWVLRDGLARDGGAEYAGNSAVTLDAAKPEQPPAAPTSLQVLSDDKNPKAILLRFNELPDVKNLAEARLTLTTQLLPEDLIYRPVAIAISCNAIRDDWVADKANWKEAAPGVPWKEKELEEGGEFLTMPETFFALQPRQKVEWDVTEAVKKARQQGRNSISLLIRADYTGHYFKGYGYDFEGPQSPLAAYRPELTLIEK
jgi:hypothetical protein